jgi:hypothetical protein
MEAGDGRKRTDTGQGLMHSASRQRGFALAFLLTVAVGLLAVAGFNFAVNPLGYYPTHLLERPATGQDRRVKLDLLWAYSGGYGTKEACGGPADALILGSSRVMTLAPETVQRLTGLRAFNAGVSVALPEDYYAVLSYLGHRRAAPKEIILGLDIIAFDPGPANQFLLLTPELASGLPWNVRWAGLMARAKVLLSNAQIQRSMDLLAQAWGRKEPVPSSFAFDADGMLHYVEKEALIEAGAFVPDIDPDVGGGELREFDAERQACFERFLSLAADHGIRVRAFLTPYHPAVLALRARDEVDWFGERRARVMEYLESLAQEYPGLTIVDFTDIRAFGGASGEFFDSVHYFSSNGDRLLAALYRTPK